MSDLVKKYLYKLSLSCDNAIMALQVIKNAPDKAFEEDINARIEAADKYIKYMQEVRRWLLYFKNKRANRPTDVL